MYATVSSRQIQREYKSILAKANKTKQPIVVMSNNEPQGAVIGLDLLEKIQLDRAAKEAMEEYRAGKTILIRSEEDLEKYLENIDK